jgi:hypothetical protein
LPRHQGVAINASPEKPLKRFHHRFLESVHPRGDRLF